MRGRHRGAGGLGDLPLNARAGAAALLAAAATLAPPAAAGEPLALVGARILPVGAAPIEDGTLLVAEGRITAIGRREEVAIPATAEVHNLAGRTIVPGLVDAHSHLGEVSGGDRSGPLHPDVRALDAVDVRSPGFKKALAGGITTVNVMPGSGHLMSGQTVYLKLRADGIRVEDWLLCDDGEPPVCGGMKMANGTNPQRGKPFPATRGKSAALVRELFSRAADYARRLATAPTDERPKRDLALEAIGELTAGRRIVHFHTHRHDDLASALRLAEEWGFRLVLHHASEGYLLADRIAAAGVAVSVNVIDSPGGKHENSKRILENLGILASAGVDVSVHTDDSVTDSRFFLRSAALAVRGGLPAERALEALTLAPARQLGLDARIGSLAPGKDADFVVLSGDPFAYRTSVEETWVEGRRVFDRARAADRAAATGGYGVYGGSESGANHCLED